MADPSARCSPGRDPYETEAQVFLDAVEAGDPGRVLSSYADALLTDRLTRAVVAATGRPGLMRLAVSLVRQRARRPARG